ncbi:aryl hydrocarbon receptor 1a isoform X2 [Neoarius graeffei]|uniref:aryl hydrocarbon receptor 1a isoform X2 n=1 Tax=Neoarius graeffei TaxID=443677 RepID=UPI00298CE64B|nr:aryl hydrocarbon receptor 1a isoform X2 [Neoarius graeffei]
METTSTKSLYASRKRRKPALKSVKETSAGAAKLNPSKRHRDRLNVELDRLASLLPFPQDVISKLDKLTVLKLSVGCLRAKSHFNILKTSSSNQRANSDTQKHVQELPEGELLLQVINGFVLVVTSTGTVFYVSSTVQDYLGFHQSDIVHQSVYELIHTEDRAEFHRQLHWALNPSNPPDTGQLVQTTQTVQIPCTHYNPEQLPPENSAFLERNFTCRLRCLLNNSSGFLAVNFQGRLKFLHGQNEKTHEGKPIPPQLALFALACPIQSPSILEIRAKNFIFRTKHKLDFTPTGCDAKAKIVLGYTEAELCDHGSGYQFIHAADMLHCAEGHVRMIRTGESGLTVFRLLTKQSGWVWVQSNARLIYKNGQPDFIIASQRVLTDEEGEEILKKRSLMLPFSFTTGEAVLYDANLTKSLGGTPSSTECVASVASGDSNQLKLPSGLDPNSLLGSILKQDESIYACPSVRAQDTEEQEEELGGIFSSYWQKNILSLPETSLFKPDPAISSRGEESNSELMSFMASLGITPEDFELLQQEELFLNIELDGRYGFEDFTDDVLTYVQESLQKKVDFALPNSSLGERCLPSIAPQPQPPSQPSIIPWSQGQQLRLHSLLTSQSQQQHSSFLVEPKTPKMQQFLPKQSYSQPQQSISMQDRQQNHQGSLQAQSPLCKQPSSTPPGLHLTLQQQSPHPASHKHGHQPEFSCSFCPEKKVYPGLKHTEVNGSDSVSVTESSSVDQRLPADLQSGLQQPGSFYLETNHLPQGLSYMNQVSTVAVNCNQELAPSCIPTGHSHVGEYLEELLTCLDSVGQEKRGQSGELRGGSHAHCAQSNHDHSMLQQPCIGQNGALGNLQGSFEEEGIDDLAAQPPQLHFNDSRPHPDLSTGSM